MSPEQITGQPATAASDIYALGVILYQLYTGRVPFRGDSPEANGTSTAGRISYEQVNLPPVPPTAVNPALSLAVQDVILRCLQKSPTRRFRSVSDLYDALAEAVGAPPMLLDPPTPPNMKLPEWSQFMRPVSDIPEPEPDDTPAEPITRPHLEKFMEHGTDDQALTRPGLHWILQEPHPTEPRRLVLPPPAYSPPIHGNEQERHPHGSGRRSKAVILLTFGILALIIAMCAIGIYWFA
jgi:serine/threonine protein kinase